MKEVTAAVIIDKGSVFIARRAPSERYGGKWEFPGGKLETGETPEECLRRELYEEFGIDTKIKNFFMESVFDYPSGTIRLLAYNAEVVAGEFKLKVHDQYKWVGKEELLNYELLPADVPIAEKVLGVLK
jgi:8-oxo-dGTP diphosphatase